MNIREKIQEIKKFKERWTGKGDEKSQSQMFWIDLLQNVFEVKDINSFIEFEDRVHIDTSTGFIDAYIPSTRVLIEQKSINKDLRNGIRQSDGSYLTPFQQAQRYIINLPVSRHPKYVITCNFKSFLIYDMERPNGEPFEILLDELENDYYLLNFLIENKDEKLKKEIKVSKEAGELIGEIYDKILPLYNNPDNENTLRSLNKLCVRLVFCLYAEDAGIFGKLNIFHDYLKKYNAEDLRTALIDLFKVLDTKEDDRSPYLIEDLAQFPYVNGGLFTDEEIEIPLLNEEVKTLLLTKASEDFNWSEISPTIFGAIFESTLNPETRRSGGMHYTSIENIHKVIDPLFLDELKEKVVYIKSLKTLDAIKNNVEKFQNEISNLKFLDPACGSGNFLTETYLSLRKLENEVLEKLYGNQIQLAAFNNPIKVSIKQFYGIEINDFAVTVAKTALWIAESQMLKETENILHMNISFLPLKSYTNIIEGNALRIDWNTILPNADCNYIMGNPPFVGANNQTKENREEMKFVFGTNFNSIGLLDYVTGWYKKAAEYINEAIECAFVSTNSISQGEQPGILWNELYKYNIKINFAYRTFRWDSEANIKAHVHCIIIGFSKKDRKEKVLFENDNIKYVKNINSYLIDASNVIIQRREEPWLNYPHMEKGNMPYDGGHLLLSENEKNEIIIKEPNSLKYIRKIMGAKEFINGLKRYCLWLKDCSPNELKSMPYVLDRVNKVKKARLEMKDKGAHKLAETPTVFREQKNPEKALVIPETSSENRRYIPMDIINSDTIITNSMLMIENGDICLLGLLLSNVHMTWMRTVAGRLEMRYRYSAKVVYNNFPWPQLDETQKERIKRTAQAILDARRLYPNSSLADLYDDLTMPPELRKAHQENDKAVMEAYGFVYNERINGSKYYTESETVAALMKMYQKLIGNDEEDIKSKLEKALEPYIGMTQLEIYKKIAGKELLNIPKNLGQMVTDLILDEAEIKKDDIIIKNTPVDEEWKPLERMSFRTLKLNEFEKDWHSSDWKKYFETIKMYIVCYEGSTQIRNGYRKLKGVKYIEFDNSDLDSFMISYNMVKATIEKQNINLLPYPSSYDKQYLEVAPKGLGGSSAYNNFLKNNNTQVCFILNKKFLENKMHNKEISYDKPVENTEIVLSKFLYTVDEIKLLFDEKTDDDINKILNEKKYLKKGKYLIKEEYYDYIDIKDNGNIIKISDEILSNNSIRRYFENECKNYNLFELYENVYITKEKIEQFGFTYIDIDNSLKEIENEYKNDNSLFSINNIFDKDYMNKYEKMSFSKELFEKILNKRIKTIQIGDELLYTYGNVDIKDMFEKIILKYRIITINEIRKIINEEYEIEVSNSRIRNYITDMEFYYNEILDKVYADKNDYYEEVYDE